MTESEYIRFTMKRLLSVLCFLLFYCAALRAQLPDLYFEQITTRNGLSNNSITCLFEDSRGFIWIGTRFGLNRYDGQTYEHFLKSNQNRNSISGNYIVRVLEDQDGIIWVATKDGGLNRFDEQAKEGFRWTALMESTDNKTGLPSNRLTDIVMLNDSVLLLTAEVNPLILLHTRNMEFRYIAPAKNVTDAVLSVRWDDAGSEIKDPFWIHRFKTFRGQIFLSPLKPGPVAAIDATSKLVLRFRDLPCTTIAEFLPEGDSLWVSGWKGGLFLQRNSGTGDDPVITEVFDAEDQINCIESLDDHTLLLGMNSTGVALLDKRTMKSRFFMSEVNNAYSIPGNRVLAMMIDRNGIVWIGTTKGLARYNPAQWKIHAELLPYDEARDISYYSVFTESSGTLRICSSAGIFKKEPADAFFRRVELDFKGQAIQVTGIVQLSDGRFMLSSEQGLFWYDPVKEQLSDWIPSLVYLRDTVIINRSHYSRIAFQVRSPVVYKDQDKEFVLAAVIGYGLLVYDVSDNVNYFLVRDEKNPLSFGDGLLLNVAIDKDRQVWLGSTQGLYRWRSEEGLVNNFDRFLHDPDDPASIPSNYITSIISDPEKGVWITTPDGLGRLVDGSCQTWLPGNDLHRVMLGGLYDQGKVWAAVLEGFEIFDVKRKTFRYQGIPHESWYPSAPLGIIKLPDGQFAYASGKHFLTFHQDDLIADRSFPDVFIKTLLVQDSLIYLKEYPDRIVLKHNQNFVQFNLAGIQVRYPGSLKIRYRLTGLEENWTESSVTSFIRFTNLTPGSYALEVQVTNPVGEWSETNTLYLLDISKPWYGTWWFYGLCLVMSLSVFRLIIFLRERSRYQIEMIRNRIANDLHDDVGSALSSIHLYSEVAHNHSQKNQQELRSLLQKISHASLEMQENMGHIIWSLQPRNAPAGQMGARLRQLAGEMLGAANIRFTYEWDDNLGSLHLSPVQRKECYLICKEALHNIIKYAACTKVTIRLYRKSESMCVDISDNGKGFDKESVQYGNGLYSMQQRAESLKGSLKITSQPGDGVLVSLCFPAGTRKIW